MTKHCMKITSLAEMEMATPWPLHGHSMATPWPHAYYIVGVVAMGYYRDSTLYGYVVCARVHEQIK